MYSSHRWHASVGLSPMATPALPHPPDPAGTETTLRAARQGDLLAFNALVLSHQDAVYTLAFRLLGDEAAAAEATQAAFVRAQRELRRPSAPLAAPFGVWMLRWLVLACQPNMFRRSLHPPASAGPGCLVTLPPALRVVLALVDLAGLDYAQTAAVLGLSPAQVRGRLALARQAMGAALPREALAGS
jgi:RNA polymerase sigma-70 factor (ECF subfamily)